MPSSTGIRAVANGVTYANWTRYELVRDLLTPADGWSLEVAHPTPDQISAIGEGASLTLLAGEEVVLRGRVDSRQVSVNRGGTRLTLQGRDRVAPLVDCSTPVGWTWRSISLVRLAELAISELGVALEVVEAEPEAETTLDVVRPEPGETFWELLTRHAARRRLLVHATPEGLRFIRPNYDQPVLGRLCSYTDERRRQNNVLQADVTWQTSQRRSPVVVLGQGSGRGRGAAPSLRGEAVDDALVALGLRRPLVIVDGEAETSAEARDRAEWEIGSRRGEGLVARYVVAGHGPAAGRCWAPDTLVQVDDQHTGLAGVYWVSAVQLSRSRDGGTTSSLTLHERGAILPPRGE
jgi:prophage tail gpP-like protein